MSGLPTPPMEDHKDSPARRSSKLSSSSKPAHRTSKRSSTSHDHGAVIIDGRHKRVWKACERCRMKKTKCDGESPCKRCKDDGLVCTAGSRKKTEFKQLPRGYAEVLENTQYALIATVQKLYTMVRNGESWDLGEPEMNDRGQPVIHDIASKLGCIRPSPDLPYAFPEGADDFAELQAQLQAARAEMGAHDTGRRKGSEDSTTSSPALDRTDRASSSESDHSALSKDYNQMLWQQQQQQEAAMSKANMSPVRTTPSKVQSQPIGRRDGLNVSLEAFDDGSYQQRASFESVQSMPSPIYTDFRPTSPVYRNASPFSPWCGGDEFLGQSHALDVTAFYMRQQSQNAPRSAPLNGSFPLQMQMNDGMNFADGTIRPGMLDCSQSMICEDTIMFQNDFENHGMGMA